MQVWDSSSLAQEFLHHGGNGMSDLGGANAGGRKRDGKHLATWIGIGTGLGVALGAAFNQVGVGLAIGVASGVAIGTALDAKKSK